jgi:hypothetical protein
MSMKRLLFWPRFAVAGIVLAVVVLVAVALARRYGPLDVEWGSAPGSEVGALSDLREGMTLEEVTAHLRQHGVAFTVDSGVDGPLITGIGRKSTTDGRVTQSSEQQIEFDARRRLRAMRTGATLQSR